MFYKLNINIDIAEAQHYYSLLETSHQDKKWTAPLGNHTIYGWSLHILNGMQGPFGFYNTNTEPLGVENYYRSDLCFGWASTILDLLPYGYRAGVGVSPAGTVVPPHIDENCQDMMRLHIPIYTNTSYVWHTHEPNLHMELGSAYLVDTSYTHSTVNLGNTPRVHLGMNIPRANFDDIKKFF